MNVYALVEEPCSICPESLAVEGCNYSVSHPPKLHLPGLYDLARCLWKDDLFFPGRFRDNFVVAFWAN